MIRRDDGARWLLISQPDHAALSGELAALWREPDGRALSPAAIRAVGHHDDGWIDREAAPRVDPATGRPAHFREATAAEHLDIWRRGPALVAAADPYAGILVSHHGSGLTAMKIRLSESLAAGERAALERYLDEQAAFREGVARDAAIDLGAPGLARDVAILRLLDYVSLVLCCGPAPARRLDVDGASLEMRPLGERRVTLDPWPFGDAGEFVRAALARALPKARYDDASLRRALAAAPRELLVFALARA